MRIDLRVSVRIPSFNSPFGKLPALACSPLLANQHPDPRQPHPPPQAERHKSGVPAKTGARARMCLHVTTSFSLTRLALELNATSNLDTPNVLHPVGVLHSDAQSQQLAKYPVYS